MRITHLIGYFQPELGYQEAYLASQQLMEGHTVIVLTSDRYRASFYEGEGAADMLGNRIRQPGRHNERGIPVQRLRTLFEAGQRVWLRGLLRGVRDFHPDAIHVHGFATLTTLRMCMAMRLRQLPSAPTLVVDDHMYPAVREGWPELAYFPARFILSPLANRAADHLIAVSEATRSYMTKYYGINADQIGMIPLGVDERVFRPDEARRMQMRKKHGYAEGDVICIYTGKIMPRKQIGILLRANRNLSSEYENFHLFLVGYAEERYKSELVANAQARGIAARIRWHSAVSQERLADYFSMADIAVWPSEHSISFLEAMASGLPIVVSDEPRSAEDAAHGNGFTFPEGDHEALAERLRTLIEHPELRKQMGAKGRLVIERDHTWRIINQRFMQLYCSKKSA